MQVKQEMSVQRDTQKRETAADVVRCTALFCVIAVHFFLNNGFYSEIVIGPRMYIMMLLRSSFMVCVPLFILLSGYLSKAVEPGWKYYRKVVKLLAVYVLASVCCALYKIFVQKTGLTLLQSISGMFAYTTAPYAWYVEMYLGLFALAPFLNIFYRGLGSRKNKLMLLATLLTLTALPGVVNIFRVADFNWLLQPSSSGEYHQLIPQWWTGIYPLTYYFIGCYLKEYPVKLKLSHNLLIFFAAFFLIGSFNYYRCYNHVFLWGAWQSWGALPTLVQTVALFNLLISLDYSRLGKKTEKFIARLSDWAFGAYLLSWIFDQIFYRILNGAVPNMQDRLPWILLIVPAVYVCSLALSAVIHGIYSLCAGAFEKIHTQLKKAEA